MIITAPAELIIKETMEQTLGSLPRPRFRGRSRTVAPFTSQAYSESAGGSVRERLSATGTPTLGANGQRSTLTR